MLVNGISGSREQAEGDKKNCGNIVRKGNTQPLQGSRDVGLGFLGRSQQCGE